MAPRVTFVLAANVAIVNLDDSTRYSTIVFGNDPFAVSVPQGHYSAIFFVEGTLTDATPVNWYTVDSQFTVNTRMPR